MKSKSLGLRLKALHLISKPLGSRPMFGRPADPSPLCVQGKHMPREQRPPMDTMPRRSLANALPPPAARRLHAGSTPDRVTRLLTGQFRPGCQSLGSTAIPIRSQGATSPCAMAPAPPFSVARRSSAGSGSARVTHAHVPPPLACRVGATLATGAD